MKRVLLASLIAAAVQPALAEALRMPDYFIDYAVDMTVASEVVAGCPELVLDPMGLNRLNVAVEAKLYEDGLFRPKDEAFAAAVRESLVDDERLTQGLDLTYRRIGIDPAQDRAGVAAASWCAAGRAEIQAASSLGRLLTDLR